MKTLRELIDACMAAKTGDKAFILTTEDGKTWTAAMGNDSQHCPIGEVIAYREADADFHVEGDSPKHAVFLLAQKMGVPTE